MLIIEGPDGAGKTTLAHKLVAELNRLGHPHVYMHLSRLPDCWHGDAADLHLRLASPFTVWDRFHLSEPLYAAACGRSGSMLTPDEYARVDRELARHGAYTVVVTAPEDALRERYQAEREMFPLETILRVGKAYRDAATHGSWGKHSVRVDQHLALDRFPEVKDVGLRAYTMRLLRLHPHQGARVA